MRAREVLSDEVALGSFDEGHQAIGDKGAPYSIACRKPCPRRSDAESEGRKRSIFPACKKLAAAKYRGIWGVV